MKRKVKVTIELDIDVDAKETKQISKDLDKWIKDYYLLSEEYPVPCLFKRFRNKPSEELTTTAKINIKVKSGRNTIIDQKVKFK